VKFNKSKAPGLLIAMGLTLTFLSLVVQRGPPNLLGPPRLFPKDVVHWFGWIGAMALMITSILSIKRWSIMKKPRRRVSIHCALGAASLLLVVIHVNSQFLLIRPAHLPSFFTLTLMVVIATSGSMARIAPGRRFVSSYWRHFHGPMSVAFYISLLYHVLQKIGGV
jgi:hypothetical protein